MPNPTIITAKGDTDRRLVSVDKAATYLGLSPRTIRRAIADGRIAGFRFGPRIVRIDLNEIDAVLRRIPTVGGAA